MDIITYIQNTYIQNTYNSYNSNQDSNIEDIYNDLIKNTEYMIENIEFALYDLYEFDPENTDYKLKEIRKNQHKFKNTVIERDVKCVITNKFIEVCQVCHIIPHCISSDEQKYDPNNGLLLSADIHILFDKHNLSINPETSSVVLNTKLLLNNEYKQYHNKHLSLNKKQLEYLQDHWQTFNKINNK